MKRGREKKKLSIEQAAPFVGVSPESLRQMEEGEIWQPVCSVCEAIHFYGYGSQEFSDLSFQLLRYRPKD